ncbi:unnamed protein product, partial [Symbiodinium sp. KB8]
MSLNDWFGPHVGPMAAVATYRSAPPRGMTNPPQNPKVRDQLIQELEEYGVALEVESWPPRAPDLQASFVFGRPSEPPNCRNPAAKLAQDLARKHMGWLRDGDTRLLANRCRPPEAPRPRSTGSLSASAGRGNTPSAPAPQPPKREPSPNKKLLAAPSAPEQSKSRGASKAYVPAKALGALLPFLGQILYQPIYALLILFHTCEVCTPGRSETMSFRETPTDRDEASEEPSDSEDEFTRRARRMVSRWSGERQAVPSREALVGRVQTRETSGPRGRVQVLGSHILEPQREVPIMDRCQVLVVGAGPAGLSAAIGARRAGADVILLERYGCFGGTITTVGMETLGWYRYEGTQDCEGIGREMERVAERMGGTTKWPYNDSDCLDAEKFKLVADNLIQESGVRPILHIWVVEALLNSNNEIYGVLTESKSGRNAILAERIIDCTGDADVAHLAGCPYSVIDVNNSLGVTTVFNAVNIDVPKFREYTSQNPATYKDWSRTWEQTTSGKEEHLKSPYLDREFEKAAEAGVIPQHKLQSFGGSWSALSEAGEATNLNLVHKKGVDATCVRSLTDAEIEGRANVMHALNALRHTVPGFENAKLRNFAMTVGTRDSRKIVGRYNLTGEDVCNQARFEDAIGIFPEFIDGYNILILPTTGRFFQVPYGCLVPQSGVDNLLVAGRAVAGDRVSHAAMRNMM